MINGEVGYTFEQYYEDEWLYGFFVGDDLRKNLTVLGEIHGVTYHEFKINDSVFNTGTQRDFTKKYDLLASAGRSFERGTSDDPIYFST